jgi:hypothetical protein
MTDPGSSVGGITFKISVDLSGVNQQGLSQLQKQFDKLHATFNNVAKAANNLSQQMQSIAGGKLIQALQSQNSTMERTAAAITKYATSVRNANAAASDHVRESEKIVRQNEKTTTSFQGLTSAVSNLFATLGGAAAASRLGAFLKDATTLASRIDVLETVLDQVGRTAGYSQGELDRYERQVKSLGITTAAARETLAAMARNQLDLARAVDVATISQNAAVLAGEDSSATMMRIVRAIQSGETELLRTIGLQVNLQQAYADTAAALGKNAAELTQNEKRQSMFAAVLAQGSAIANVYTASMADVGKRLTTLPRLWEEARKELGEQFQPVLRAIVDTTSSLLRQFTEMGPAAKAMTTAVIPAAATFGSLAAAIGAAKLAMTAFGVAAADTAVAVKQVTTATMRDIADLTAAQGKTIEQIRERLQFLNQQYKTHKILPDKEELQQLGDQITQLEGDTRETSRLLDIRERAIAAAWKIQDAHMERQILLSTKWGKVQVMLTDALVASGRELSKLWAIIAANPLMSLTLGLTAASYAISALMAYQKNLILQHEEAKKAAGEQAAGIVEVQDTMKRLKPPIDDSAQSQRMFNSEIERVVSLLPQYSKQLSGLATAQEKYSWILSNVPSVGKTALDIIAEMDTAIENQKKRTEEARARMLSVSATPRGSSDVSRLELSAVAAYDREAKALDILMAKREAVMDSMLAREVRYYGELEKRQSGAYESAMSLEQELANAKRKNADDAISKAIEEYESYRSQLEKTAMTVEQIEKSENAKLEQKKRALEETTAAKLKEAKTDEMKSAIQNAHAQELALLEKETAHAIEQQVKQRDKVIAGMKTALELLKERLSIEGAQIAKRQEQMDREKRGENKELISLDIERAEIVKNADAQIAEYEKQIAELRKSGGDPEEIKARELAIQQIRQKTSQLLVDNMDKQRSVIQSEIETRKTAIQKLEDATATSEKRITDLTIDEIQKRRDARMAEYKEVEKAIADRTREQFLEKNPSAKKPMEIRDKYVGLMEKAQTAEQIAALSKAAREDLSAAGAESRPAIQAAERQLAQLRAAQLQMRRGGDRRGAIAMGAQIDQAEKALQEAYGGVRFAQQGAASVQAAGRRRLGELGQQAQVVAAENAREQQLLTTNQQQLQVQQQQLGVLLQMLERLGGQAQTPTPVPMPPAASPTPRGIPNLPIVRPPIIKVPAPIPPRGAGIPLAADDSLLDPATGLAGSAANAQSAVSRGLTNTGNALKAARNSLDSLADVASLSAAEMSAMENGMMETDRRVKQVKQHYK